MNLVIFDMDGTIIDTIQDIHNSLLITLDKYELEPIEIKYTKRYVGSGMRQLVINAVGEENFKDEMETYFRSVYKEKMMENTCIIKGFKSVLRYIDYSKIKAVILSNKIRQISDDMVKHFDIGQYFVEWYGGDSFGVKKPAPYGVSKIIEEHNELPHKTIMIGDSYSDILAGAGAGARTCFCSYGYGTLNNVSADYIANTPKDIIRILEGI